MGNFEQFIEQNKPVTFTDPTVLMMLFPTLNNGVNYVIGGSVHLWTPRPFLELLWDSVLNGSEDWIVQWTRGRTRALVCLRASLTLTP